MWARADMETSSADAGARMQQVEDRCSSLEARLAEAVQLQFAGLERANERSERISTDLDQVRLNDKAQGAGIQGLIERVLQLEDSLTLNEHETREMCARERQSREDHLARTQKAMLSERQAQIVELEQRMQYRLDRESEARMSTTQRILDEVGCAMEKMGSTDTLGTTVHAETLVTGPTNMAALVPARNTSPSPPRAAIRVCSRSPPVPVRMPRVGIHTIVRSISPNPISPASSGAARCPMSASSAQVITGQPGQSGSFPSKSPALSTVSTATTGPMHTVVQHSLPATAACVPNSFSPKVLQAGVNSSTTALPGSAPVSASKGCASRRAPSSHSSAA